MHEHFTKPAREKAKQEMSVRYLSTIDNPDAQSLLIEASQSWFLPSNIKEMAKAGIRKK